MTNSNEIRHSNGVLTHRLKSAQRSTHLGLGSRAYARTKTCHAYEITFTGMVTHWNTITPRRLPEDGHFEKGTSRPMPRSYAWRTTCENQTKRHPYAPWGFHRQRTHTPVRMNQHVSCHSAHANHFDNYKIKRIPRRTDTTTTR